MMIVAPKSVVSKARKINLSALILLSYLIAICFGTVLLCLPVSTASGSIALIDAFFTATSAVCVTGLTVVDTGSAFSVFGQLVVLLLIQLGGLGLMTFSVIFFLSIGKRVSLRHRMIMQEVFAHTPREDIYGVVKAIFAFTALVEGGGALSLLAMWADDYPLWQALHLAVFHSVSAFCNAGFGLFSNNLMDYKASAQLNLTICSLIVLGGIGFPVVYELTERFKRRKERRARLSIQVKSVLTVTALLILLGMGFFILGEYDNILLGASWEEAFWVALFQSVTTRTAGFNTVDIGRLNDATLAFMIFLMFWGASPGSCGGGVKTTTLAVLGAFTWSRMRRSLWVNISKKTIPQDTLSKSISLVVLSISFISVIFFLLLITHEVRSADGDSGREFLEYLFEVVSAFGTVGLSMGATMKLNSFGKILIMLMMLIGRVGVLTFAYIFAGTEARGGIRHAEQNLMIG